MTSGPGEAAVRKVAGGRLCVSREAYSEQSNAVSVKVRKSRQKSAKVGID